MLGQQQSITSPIACSSTQTFLLHKHVTMNDVKKTLDALGFGEVRLTDDSDWRPTADLNGEMGTTSQTRIRLPRAFEQHAHLLDAETDEVVALARKSYPINR
jgi:hypothetical protein